jgi:hypothetical protein
MRERRLLTSGQVCERLGNIHRSTLHRWRTSPEVGFPEPVRTINRIHYWGDDQIDDFAARAPDKAA